jgi:hypothetical protein
MRNLANYAGSLRVGGDFPHKNKNLKTTILGAVQSYPFEDRFVFNFEQRYAYAIEA